MLTIANTSIRPGLERSHHCRCARSVVPAWFTRRAARRPSPSGDESVRGGTEGETYHAEAAGAGAACEGALLIAPTSGIPQLLEMAPPFVLPRARRHASPRPRLRSDRTASPSPANAAERSQQRAMVGRSPAHSGAALVCQARAPVAVRQGKPAVERARVWDVGRRGAHAAPAPQGPRPWERRQSGPANSARVAPVERFAASECPRPTADVVGIVLP